MNEDKRNEYMCYVFVPYHKKRGYDWFAMTIDKYELSNLSAGWNIRQFLIDGNKYEQ